MDLPKTTDVLIVEAGPTGLTLTCILARYGIDFLLIDEAMKPSTVMKASLMTPRTVAFRRNRVSKKHYHHESVST